MTSFSSYLDSANPHKHIISSYSLDPKLFMSNEEGIRLGTNIIQIGVLGISGVLEPETFGQVPLEGTLSMSKAHLSGSREALDASIDGHFIIRDAATSAEVVTIEFIWYLGVTVTVKSITFAADEVRVDNYFNGLKYTAAQKLSLTLKDFELYAPMFLDRLLKSEYIRIKDVCTEIEKPSAHIETDWDVLD